MKAKPRITFYCTDRGSHRRIELGHTTYGNVVWSRHSRKARPRPQYDDQGKFIGNHVPGESGKRTLNGRTVLAPYAMVLRPILATQREIAERRLFDYDSPTGYQFLCPTCGRNPQISGKRFEAALKGLRAAGITEVDISRLAD